MKFSEFVGLATFTAWLIVAFFDGVAGMAVR